MTGHPDADVLAEFGEGLLGRRRSARIRAHLAGCSRCASVSGQLAEVAALLASAPAPAMPGQLAARLDGVLAAESAARARRETPAAASEIPAAAGASDGGSERDGRHRGLRRPAARSAHQRPWRVAALRAASVTAAILVLAGGGYGVSRLLQGGAPGTTASSGASAPRNSGREAAPAAGIAGGRTGPNVQPQVRRQASGITVIDSGTNYLPGRLVAQVHAVLARPPARPAGQAAASGARQAAALRGCVNLFTGGAPARLVDAARYQGRPATIIVTGAAGGRPAQVWVAGPGCSASTRDLIAHAPLTGTG